VFYFFLIKTGRVSFGQEKEISKNYYDVRGDISKSNAHYKKYPLPHPPCSLYMTKRNLSKGAVIISGKNTRGVAVQNALKI